MLQRLIRWIGWRVRLMNTGRCALCRERPLVTLIPAARGGYDVGPPVSTEPCPGCGWQPDVIEVFGSPASHEAGAAIAASHLYFDDAMGWGVIRNLTGRTTPSSTHSRHNLMRTEHALEGPCEI